MRAVQHFMTTYPLDLNQVLKQATSQVLVPNLKSSGSQWPHLQENLEANSLNYPAEPAPF